LTLGSRYQLRNLQTYTSKRIEYIGEHGFGITLQEILEASRECSGSIYVYDKTGGYVTTPTYRLEEGSLIIVVAPTEKALSTCIDRLNKLFTLAERVYASLEARKPFGG